MHLLSRQFLAVLFAVLPFFVFAQDEELDGPAARNATEWSDISVFEQNRLYPRSNVVPYDDEDDTERWAYRRSSSYMLLEDWRVSYTADFVDRVAEIENGESFSAAQWQRITLPDVRWTDNGKSLARLKLGGSAAIPAKGNATATYYTEFDVDEDWKGYDVFLQFQPLSACYVWVNHHYVGYVEDSRSLSEFDITKHILPNKTNNIILQQVSLSTATLMEANADPSLLGFGNDVALCLKSAVNVGDFAIRASYAAGIGTFSFDADIANRLKKGRYYVEVELWGPDGKRVEKMGKWIFFDKRSEMSVSMDRDLQSVKPWSSELPNLYTAVVRLLDEKMQTVEVVGARFGFRTVEVQGNRWLINGTLAKFNGVIYADFTADADGVVDYDLVEEDLKMMKRCNINAIRTAAYSPADDRFYELCDKYGFYVVCDANINPYSTQSKAIAADNAYANLFVARVQNMYERLKNHPCIVAWSLGDATDNGPCMTAAFKQLKLLDRTRPVLFAAAGYGENTDVIALRNASRDQVRQYLSRQQSRPLVMLSYGSTEGNNMGGIDELWQLVRYSNGVQGGFLKCWNYYRELNNGSAQQHNGLLDGSRQLQPAAAAVAEMYSSFALSLHAFSVDAGEFVFSNNSQFLTATDYTLEYNVFTNLKPSIVAGEVSALPMPDAAKQFKLKMPHLRLYAGEELFIRFTVRQRRTLGGIAKGTVLYEKQFTVPMETVGRQPLPDYDRQQLKVVPTYSSDTLHRLLSLAVSGTWGSALVDMTTGDLADYTFHGVKLLTTAPRLNFWRLPTVNDRCGNTVAKGWGGLRPDQLRRTLTDIAFSQPDSFTVSVDMMSRYANAQGVVLMDVRQTMLILHTGDVVLSTNIMSTDALHSVARVGMQLGVNKTLDNVQWMGLDGESYPDRMAGRMRGVYKTKAKDVYYRYALPQEAGAHCQTSWVSLHNDAVGLFADMLDTAFSFSCYPYSDLTLARATSYNGLAEQNAWTLNVDYAMSGIGSASTGSDIDEHYVVANHRTRFVLHLCGYDFVENDPVDFTRNLYPVPTSNVLEMPAIARDRDRFDGPLTITITTVDTVAEIRYTLDGSDPSLASALYTGPFSIESSTTIKARAFHQGDAPSFTAILRCDYDYIVSATFDKKPNTPYNHNAAQALFDGETGSVDDLSQGWLGFSGGDCGVTLQLSKPIDIDKVRLRFAHNPSAWVFAPRDVSVSFSYDGKTFADSAQAIITFRPEQQESSGASLQHVDVKAGRRQVKAIRIKAYGIGRIPEWHRAKGLKPWLLIDEIGVVTAE